MEEINLILVAIVTGAVMFIIFLLMLTNANLAQEGRKYKYEFDRCKDEIFECKITIATLNAELKYINGVKDE